MGRLGAHAGEWAVVQQHAPSVASEASATDTNLTASDATAMQDVAVATVQPEAPRCACVQLWPLQMLPQHRLVLPAVARVALAVAEGDPICLSRLRQAPRLAKQLVLHPPAAATASDTPGGRGEDVSAGSTLLLDAIRGMLQGQAVAVGEIIALDHEGQHLVFHVSAASPFLGAGADTADDAVRAYVSGWETRIRIDAAPAVQGGEADRPQASAAAGNTQRATTSMVGGLQRQVS